MDKGSHPLKGSGFRATLKPDLEPDKAASKTPLLTFSRRLLTTSFSPRPWPVLRHRTVDRVQQLEKTSRATFALGDVSFLRGSAPWLETPFPASLGGGRCSDPGGTEKCRAARCLPEPQQKPHARVLLLRSEASPHRTAVSGSKWTTVPVCGAEREGNGHGVSPASV